MKSLKLTLLALIITPFSWAQINTPAPSPSATLTQEVGLATVTISYSRPGVKGRAIFGELVKYDELWRTGANAATKLTFSDEVELAGNKLAAGDYVILTIPTASEWTLNIYEFDKSGVGGYFDKEAMGSATLRPSRLTEAVETFTIDINNIKNSSATIDIIWENTRLSIPLVVSTDGKVMAQIAQLENGEMAEANAGDYNSAALYLLTEKKQLKRALGFSNKAVEMRPEAFWMIRTKSLILAEMGKYKQAIKVAKESIAAAEKSNNAAYVTLNKDSIRQWEKM